MFGNIIKSIQDSAEGWKMFLGGGSAEVRSIGTAIIGPGFSAAQQRFVGIKAGEVVQSSAEAPVGVRYIPVNLKKGPIVELPDPGTPATVVERIQKSISNSAEGWRMGFASVAGKAQAGIEKSLAGWQMGISEAGGKVSESFGNVGDWFKSSKWQMLLPIIILAFIAVMVAIGYSGLGAPAARVAEREYVKRR